MQWHSGPNASLPSSKFVKSSRNSGMGLERPVICCPVMADPYWRKSEEFGRNRKMGRPRRLAHFCEDGLFTKRFWRVWLFLSLQPQRSDLNRSGLLGWF